MGADRVGGQPMQPDGSAVRGRAAVGIIASQGIEHQVGEMTFQDAQRAGLGAPW
jgi:hypothetical protein